MYKPLIVLSVPALVAGCQAHEPIPEDPVAPARYVGGDELRQQLREYVRRSDELKNRLESREINKTEYNDQVRSLQNDMNATRLFESARRAAATVDRAKRYTARSQRLHDNLDSRQITPEAGAQELDVLVRGYQVEQTLEDLELFFPRENIRGIDRTRMMRDLNSAQSDIPNSR